MQKATIQPALLLASHLGADPPAFDRCPHHHSWQLVTTWGRTPGFTGAPIWFWSLACGCDLADTSRDNLGAAL